MTGKSQELEKPSCPLALASLAKSCEGSRALCRKGIMWLFRFLSQRTALGQEQINIKQSKKAFETPIKPEIYNHGGSEALEQSFSSSSGVKNSSGLYRFMEGLCLGDTCSELEPRAVKFQPLLFLLPLYLETYT